MLIRAKQLKASTIDLPLSKSVVNRAIVLECLYGGNDAVRQMEEQLRGEALCDDIRVMLGVAQQLNTSTDFYVEASGTAMRFSTALMAVCPGTRTITGTPRLCQRPIAPLVDALRQLGADIEYLGDEGFPPLRITGNAHMKGGNLSIRGDISSQFISALLMIAPTFRDGLQLDIQGELVSKPYVEMTKRMTDAFARGTKTAIEPDWSAAAFWYEISLLSGIRFDLKGLRPDSVQGDRVCHDIFSKINDFIEENVTSDGAFSADAMPFEYDFTECPDLAQAVVVSCCMKHVPFHFTGLQTLRIKETDRIAALQTELAKLGFSLDVTDSEITLTAQSATDAASTNKGEADSGGRGDRPVPAIDTYNDHRMAMAFAPCAITLGEIEINNPEVVTKSYPTFWSDLRKAGFEL